MSQVVGLPKSACKSITSTAWVRAWLCNLQKRCTRLAASSDNVYHLLAHGRWFSPVSSTTKTGRRDIAEMLLKVALKYQNQSVIEWKQSVILFEMNVNESNRLWDRRGRDRIVIGCRTTYVISVYHHLCCQFKSRSRRGVLDITLCDNHWRQVGGFLRVPRFRPPIKLTTTI